MNAKLMTVHEVSCLANISVRTLHYYDSIGLLSPTEVTESGYRLYDEEALGRLQCILLFKEMQFPLKDIKGILDSPTFERNKALDQQIELLKLKREHLDNLIELATGIKMLGVKKLMSFEAFDTKKIDEYARQAKESYGTTEAYKEFQKKSAGRTKEEENQLGIGMMDQFKGFAKLITLAPENREVQKQVAALQSYITENFYTCTSEILYSLSLMYGGGGAMTEGIDKYAGEGVAEFAAEAIRIYCGK